MLKLDWGDAQVWMDLAATLYFRNVPNARELLPRPIGYPRGNELNVAAVAAGYAFEIIFKVLVSVGGNQPEPKHDPSAAYKRLHPTDRGEVDRIITRHGWHSTKDLLAFLDADLCHRDRKYWMRPPTGGPAHGAFNLEGPKSIGALKKLHRDISELALDRINERDVDERWPGTECFYEHSVIHRVIL